MTDASPVARALVALVTSALVLLGCTAESNGHSASSDVHASSAAAPVLAVSPFGDDGTCARGDLSRPCVSFYAAYRLARCGDTVQVASGGYGLQQIREVERLSACSANVTFQPAAGALVSVEQFDFGDGIGTLNSPDRITLKDLAVRKRVNLFGDVENVTLENIDGGSFAVQGANNVLVKGGDWGPCDSSGPTECRTQSFILEDTRVGEVTRNVIVDGATFHDYRITAPGDHLECLFATGGTNVAIRNSRFYNCETYGIAAGARDWADFNGWVIENNFFGRTCCFETKDRSSALILGGDVPVTDTLIRFNTFIAGQGVVTEGQSAGANVRIVQNILQFTGCVPGAQYAENLFNGGRCSATDRNAVYGYVFDGTRLRLDPPRSKAVQAAYEAVARGSTLIQSARMVARKWGHPPPGGWRGRTLRKLLSDDLYLGRRLGRQEQHARLVSPARWKRVQKVLSETANP